MAYWANKFPSRNSTANGRSQPPSNRAHLEGDEQAGYPSTLMGCQQNPNDVDSVLRTDSDTLCVDCTQVGVLKEGD